LFIRIENMKKALLLGIVSALMVFGIANIASAAQNPDCASNPNIRLGGQPDCKVVSGEGVGLAPELESQILGAVDLFGSRISAENPAGVCIKGSGGLLFSSARNAPRVAFWSWYFTTEDGFTCTNISEPGTVILVSVASPFGAGQSPTGDTNSGTPATPVPGAPTTSGTPTPVAPTSGTSSTSVTLTNCTVVTRAILNFREEPSTSSAVIDLIPFRTILTAIERRGDWFRVIFGDENGWVAARLVTVRGRCS
jgi:hypothetical protein